MMIICLYLFHVSKRFYRLVEISSHVAKIEEMKEDITAVSDQVHDLINSLRITVLYIPLISELIIIDSMQSEFLA